MAPPRRFLPPLKWIAAFEAVARHGSVTDAAAELNLTQGAVSRQLQKLESQIGLKLFARDKRRLVLTPTGAAYAAEVADGMAQIANAAMKLHANPEGGTLELAILPAFGTHWLAPRLPQFLGDNPGVTINLSTRTAPFDFARERFHAAIHFGRNDWPGTDALLLMDEEIVPVFSESLAHDHQIERPQDLLKVPLLHLQTRPRAWTRWFAAQGEEDTGVAGMGFDQFATMAKAAAAGLGAALLPTSLAATELDRGTLRSLSSAKVTSIGSYYLVWPRVHADYPPLVAMRNWIADSL
jgi:DNA-binding transcriptional LysR family regulator